MKKTLTMVLAFALIFALGIGATLAWLTATSDEVKNTFTTSDINITLTETTTDYKMVPGYTIAKDPKVTVVANSEPCYLFVKVEEGNNFASFMEYEIVTDWLPLNDANNDGIADDGIYYREVAASTSNQAFPVLKNNQVLVKDTVTKTMMNNLNESTRPTLTFTAYASQLYKTNGTEFTPAEAWAVLNPTNP